MVAPTLAAEVLAVAAGALVHVVVEADGLPGAPTVSTGIVCAACRRRGGWGCSPAIPAAGMVLAVELCLERGVRLGAVAVALDVNGELGCPP
eukprot:14684424-Heterocapsa_arctica.AAC.1